MGIEEQIDFETFVDEILSQFPLRVRWLVESGCLKAQFWFNGAHQGAKINIDSLDIGPALNAKMDTLITALARMMVDLQGLRDADLIA